MTIAAFLAKPCLAQDFGALLEAVDRVETSLKQDVEAEKAERQQAIKELAGKLEALRAEIVARQGGSTDPAKASDLSSLKEENSRLKQQLDEQALAIVELNARLNNMPAGNSPDCSLQLAGLAAEMTALRLELHSMEMAQSSDLAVPGPVEVNLPEEALTEGEEVTGLEISGFFDVLATQRPTEHDQTDFAVNQAELDLEHQLAENIVAGAAVAYNAEEGVFELAAAMAEITLLSGEDKFVRGISVTAGQFDVPFGIDYQVYASPDRNLITSPMVVDMTHGGWSDLGVQFSMTAAGGNLVLYGVNGFASSIEVLDEAATLATGEEVYEEIDTTPAAAFGGRLGIKPLSFLEFGWSFASGWNIDSRSEMYLAGGDLQCSLYDFDLKGEFIYHSLNRSVAEENNRGYYLQGTYHLFDRAFVTSRYGSFRVEQEEWRGQYSFGIGYKLVERVELRFESVIDEDSDRNANIMQLVAGF